MAGGGPAGLAAAIALQMRGASTVVLEARTPPIDKACGEGLMPDTLAALRALGVAIPAGAGQPFYGIEFVGGARRARADFPNGPALGMRRTLLHSALAARAAEADVEIRWGSAGVRLVEGGVKANGEFLRSRLVVGADGQNSSIRQSANLNAVKYDKRRYGFRRHYAVAPWSSHMELHWGKDCQLYITPISESEISVALLTRNPKQRLGAALALFPELRERLADAKASSNEMGSITTGRAFKRVTRDSVALVGDASGSVDAITGEGLGLAVREAYALAEAFAAGDMAIYQRAHEEIRRRPAMMGSLLLLLDRHSVLQRAALATLAACPPLFGKLLAVHVGNETASRATEESKCYGPAC